jgi:hypothetical protein
MGSNVGKTATIIVVRKNSEFIDHLSIFKKKKLDISSLIHR